MPVPTMSLAIFRPLMGASDTDGRAAVPISPTCTRQPVARPDAHHAPLILEDAA